MSVRFAVRHARRETRAAARRIGPYLLSITLGVAALVAIQSYRGALIGVIGDEARNLLGGDVRLSAGEPLSPAVLASLDSAGLADGDVARTVTAPSMVYAPRSGLARLAQLRAVSAGFPIYGRLEAKPADAWARLERGSALVEPALLLQLDIAVGDSLRVGASAFRIAGTVEEAGGGFGFGEMLGAKVYVPLGALDEMGLIGTGSLARYEAYLRLETEAEIEAFLAPRDSLLRAERIEIDTAKERAGDVTDALDGLTRFLSLVGLLALLLGGIGVGSAVGIYVRERIPTIAVLRCMGATQRTLFGAYLMQAALLGIVGAAAGAVLGVGAYAALRPLLAGGMPIAAPFRVDPAAIGVGLFIGGWVALVFALVPLLDIREVTPLQALRRAYEEVRASRLARVLGTALLIASVVAIAIWQAPTWQAALVFAAGIVGVIVLLRLAAGLLMRLTRRLLPTRADYTVRQGLANLFRPRNQTVAVTLALGFGVFAVGALLVVQHSLLAQLRIETMEGAPNLLFFDVQPDQRESLARTLEARGVALREVTPIVPARLAGINGRPIEAVMEDSVGRPERWAVEHEYRHTYRDSLGAGEEVVEGEWFGDRAAPAGSLPRISVEIELAGDLEVGVGDTLTWDVQGVDVVSVITSLRRVDWTRFEPNFFVIFEPGPLTEAPQMLVALGAAPDDSARAQVQADVARALPNVVALDLDRVQRVIRTINQRVTLGIGSIGALSIAAGIVVLFAAVATSRRQRLSESALLRALGADRRRIRRILVTEYAALGLLAALSGALLAAVAGWGLTRFFFELPLVFPFTGFAVMFATVVLLTVVVGALGTREAMSGSPLGVLRATD